ncbi:hypothetical protein B0H14DRAFT_3473065 [Mycena olivaceomarginata]|nr:hypothetical protein B0H14DRAFT_3473065 [Mycena olivaceomarginata]
MHTHPAYRILPPISLFASPMCPQYPNPSWDPLPPPARSMPAPLHTRWCARCRRSRIRFPPMRARCLPMGVHCPLPMRAHCPLLMRARCPLPMRARCPPPSRSLLPALALVTRRRRPRPCPRYPLDTCLMLPALLCSIPATPRLGPRYPLHAPRWPPCVPSLPAAPMLDPCPMRARCPPFPA